MKSVCFTMNFLFCKQLFKRVWTVVGNHSLNIRACVKLCSKIGFICRNIAKQYVRLWNAFLISVMLDPGMARNLKEVGNILLLTEFEIPCFSKINWFFPGERKAVCAHRIGRGQYWEHSEESAIGSRLLKRAARLYCEPPSRHLFRKISIC